MLWSSVGEQPNKGYVLDPGTRGRGIYLVLRLGRKGVPVPRSGQPTEMSMSF